MNPRRRWTLVAVFATLLLVYALFFTDWVRPAPIQIASQVRFAIQPPRFGRPAKKPLVPGKLAETNHVVPAVRPFERIAPPEKGAIDPAPGGAANVTFSFDAFYELTHVRVEDVPADGTPPKLQWELVGKSRPTRSLLYNRVPEGMQVRGGQTNAEALIPGVPYRLLLEAGRRRGTNLFSTTALRAPE